MIGFVILAALALASLLALRLFGRSTRPTLVSLPPPAPEPIELPEPEIPKPADLDPQVDLADLLARANEQAGGRYLKINVGKSRAERRADAAREDRETKLARKAERRKLERERASR